MSDRLERAMARLGSEHEPPPGWEDRVLARTQRRGLSPWEVAAIVIAVAGACAVAALVSG